MTESEMKFQTEMVMDRAGPVIWTYSYKFKELAEPKNPVGLVVFPGAFRGGMAPVARALAGAQDGAPGEGSFSALVAEKPAVVAAFGQALGSQAGVAISALIRKLDDGTGIPSLALFADDLFGFTCQAAGPKVAGS